MSYSSLAVQAYNLGHFFLAFIVVFVVFPRALFAPVQGSRLDNAVSMYMRMTLFVIAVGYGLLVTKLYEVFGFMAVIAAMAWIRRSRRGDARNTVSAAAMALFYDAIEARYVMASWLRQWRAWREGVRVRIASMKPRWHPSTLEGVLLLVIVLVSVYIRGTDAVLHPQPSMSDGYVTLAWVKYVNERILFHDGIYPQGMYFYLSMLGKLAFINPLFVLKYGGPLNTVLIVVGLHYSVSRFTGRRDLGLIAALLYGILGQGLLGGDWNRQTATNSQEMGLVFVAPTLYYLHRYLQSGDRVDRSTAICGLCVTGLTHPLAYALTLIGCLSVWVSHWWFPGPFSKGRLLKAFVGGWISAGVAIAPVAVGYLFGRRFNRSGASFVAASSTSPVSAPTLTWMDWLGVAAIGILLLATIWELSKGTSKRHPEWAAAAIFGALVFGLYDVGGIVTGSVVVIARMVDLWAVVEPFTVAMAAHVLVTCCRKEIATRWVTTTALGGTVAASAAFGMVNPIIPYKMQFAEGVQAYLHIDQAYRYQGYMLVANDEEYALVLGSGYRMSIHDFVTTYDPTLPALTKYGQHQVDRSIAPNVFIYYPEKIFEVDKRNTIYSNEQPIYQSRMEDKALLTDWLNVYRQHHSLKIYAQDPNLIVYQIATDPPKPEATHG